MYIASILYKLRTFENLNFSEAQSTKYYRRKIQMKDFDRVEILLQKYKEEHGDCLVPQKYITEDGIKLGSIVSRIRTGDRTIDAIEKARLDNIGFVWKVNESPLPFEEVIKLLQEYKKKNGDCLVPREYITEDGFKLGPIVNSIRTGSRKTSVEEKTKLDSLGFVWKVHESSFEEVIKLLQVYKKQNGDCLVPQKYTTEEGIKLGSIVSHIRKGERKISADEKARLDSLGFVWKAKKGKPKKKS